MQTVWHLYVCFISSAFQVVYDYVQLMVKVLRALIGVSILWLQVLGVLVPGIVLLAILVPWVLGLDVLIGAQECWIKEIPMLLTLDKSFCTRFCPKPAVAHR